MPQLVPVTLTDSASVSRTFAADNVDRDGTGWLSHNPNGVFAFANTLTVSGRKTVGSQNRKANAMLTMPVVRTVGGIDTRVGANLMKIEGRFDASSTPAERAALKSTLIAFLESTEYEKVFTEGEAVF